MQEGAAQVQQNVEPTYSIDAISDDELYAYDLRTRVPDITDEELLAEVERAKTSNPELYAKQVQGIRAEYKALEDEDNAQKQAIEQENYQAQQQVFTNNILNAIDELDSIGTMDVDLDDEDKQELANFILGSDQAGNNYLQLALNDPATLTKMAWFALHGDGALDEIQDYFNQQITSVRQQAYKQGVEDERRGKAQVVIQKPKKAENKPMYNNNVYKSIDDLD